MMGLNDNGFSTRDELEILAEELYESILGEDTTANDLLQLLLTIDGVGSGIDADLLDGQQGTYYASQTDLTTKVDKVAGKALSTNDFTDANLNRLLLTYVSPGELLTAIKTVDGAGSGLDADSVRGEYPVDFKTAYDDSHVFDPGSGYQRLKNGFTIIWGQADVPTATDLVVNLPLTLSVNWFQGFTSYAGTAYVRSQVKTKTPSQITLFHDAVTTIAISYLIIGA